METLRHENTELKSAMNALQKDKDKYMQVSGASTNMFRVIRESRRKLCAQSWR